LLHLKRHLFLILFWILLFLIVTQNFGNKYGIPYLFLDPEYLGRVNFLSFFILGFAFGGFLLLFNLTSYILNSNRFPFLATFRHPFVRYCYNNSVIPAAFIFVYCIALLRFQSQSEFHNLPIALFYLAGFITGMSVLLIIAFSKFLNTNIENTITEAVDVPAKKAGRLGRFLAFDKLEAKKAPPIRVDYFLYHVIKLRRTRSVRHYKKEHIYLTFRHHHINALIVELISLTAIIFLAYFTDVKYFQVPAGASICLLFSILIAPSGAISFWLRGWGATLVIIVLFVLNIFMRNGYLLYDNKAFGLNYDTIPATYNLEQIEKYSSQKNYYEDKDSTLAMLENWKKKFPTEEKPLLLLINSSGGGLRSSLWAVKVMQEIDSVTHNSAYEHTVMVTGASAGLIGQAFYRELQLESKTNHNIDPNNYKYLWDISRDILNPIAFSVAVNDLIYPWVTVQIDGKTYHKDRGYSFERKLLQNTHYILNKKVSDYNKPEQDAVIPMMIISPTITDDGRRVLFASHPVTYLTRPSDSTENKLPLNIDAIDGSRFFKNQQVQDLHLTSALRLNATFPYILPNSFLPTSPPVQVMDAGLRDNYGAELSIRFLSVFKNWIDSNTSGVVIIQTRDWDKIYEPMISKKQTLIDKFFDPIGSIYINWSDYQDYYLDDLLQGANRWLGVPIHVLEFEYKASILNQEASMSFHLTSKEKHDIMDAIKRPSNIKAMNELQDLLKN